MTTSPKFSVNRQTLITLVNRIDDCWSWEVREAITDFIAYLEDNDQQGRKNGWHSNAIKLLDTWDSVSATGDTKPTLGFSVFAANGNVKLPFVSFSTLPGVTCPGAGDCLKFCYSYKAWRYPAAFFRQLQNTLLMKYRRSVVHDAFDAIVAKHARKLSAGKTDKKLQFRLYVDGDFATINELKFWMQLLACNVESVDAYGYSKSWDLFEEYDNSGFQWPKNYRLNLSSGSRHENDARLFLRLSKLPICRGEFVALEIDKAGLAKGFKVFDQKEYHARVRSELRAKYPGKKIVSCGGTCGTCDDGNGKHWCASDRLHDIVIGIGVHGSVGKKGE